MLIPLQRRVMIIVLPDFCFDASSSGKGIQFYYYYVYISCFTETVAVIIVVCDIVILPEKLSLKRLFKNWWMNCCRFYCDSMTILSRIMVSITIISNFNSNR